jgi:hypothetical protein
MELDITITFNNVDELNLFSSKNPCLSWQVYLLLRPSNCNLIIYGPINNISRIEA